ncbi:MAG: nucleotide exchange factor GrpE [Planctomycetes bacterium]|nr:nucleotide exchange factor GrpE [Planctomycetota bacterium]
METAPDEPLDESLEGETPSSAEPVAPPIDEAAERVRLEGEVKALKERLLEAHADRDNQAKRFGRERQVVRDEITSRMAREMIEVLDNLDLVLQALPEAERESPLAQGVALTRVVFLDKLKNFGIEPVVTSGLPFSPFQHEAVYEEERTDVAPGTIVGEITRGYRMGSHLVRAAKVRIAKAPAAAGAN